MRSEGWLIRVAVISSLWLGAYSIKHNVGSRRLHGDLDVHSSFHAHQFPNGQETLNWLSDDSLLVPELAHPPEEWPSNLVIGYAGGYKFEALKPLIYGFLENVDTSAWLVLLVPKGDDLGLSHPVQSSGRVVIQEHAVPHHLDWEDIPYPVSLRFFVTVSLLRRIGHHGTVFFLDTRDVFIQRDPFEGYSDGVLHFPRESASYRLKGPYTYNSDWILQCYGNDTLAAIGGNYVLNSGTLIGPSWMMLKHFELLLKEMEARWHCRRFHGSDQAMHNYLVYTGKVMDAGLQYQIEDQVGGQFGFIAYTHPQLWDFRYHSEGREEVFNKGDGRPYVAIHMWPGDNRVANNVIKPFVAEFDSRLHHGTHSRRNHTFELKLANN